MLGIDTANHTMKVSIHAPAWGATVSITETISKNVGFNPRPRMGGDRWIYHY